jgi:superfamily II DNA or RNA helicase
LELGPEQQEAVDRSLAALTYGVFDPQGAGKTAVAINTAMTNGKFPVLITVPAHLVLQWRMQLELWGVPAEEIAAAPRGCGPIVRHNALRSDVAFTLVSYNTWASYDYMPEVLDPRWQAYLFDESHRLRKGSSVAWHHAKLLRTKTRTTHVKTPIWWYSGTPLVKDASDIWPFLFLVNKWKYGNRDRFIRNTCHTFQGDYSLQIGAVRDPESFHRLLASHSIRRAWSDIPSLAKLSRRDIDLPVELDPETVHRHRTIKRDYRDPKTNEPLDSSAAMIHALRRLSVPAKVAALTEWRTDHPGPVLVLNWYRDTARSVALALSKTETVAYIDGGVSEKNRQAAFASYQLGSVLVGTIGSLKEGLNLQSGYQVLFVEQHFLHTDNEQALARVLRRGQKRPVLVYWMFAPRTFDMRVRKVARSRKANIEQALNEFVEREEWSS